ncbi:hypothetical protein DWE98_07540 [Bosea caraganae]|uniref:Uncharacterized protein n=1 Tax=Bosea caraganae TaxID=2763117 RepID=A0A370L8H5_9HYPH|nr:hypothetical protein DWE98_07540 [Bosea caraganae]
MRSTSAPRATDLRVVSSNRDRVAAASIAFADLSIHDIATQRDIVKASVPELIQLPKANGAPEAAPLKGPKSSTSSQTIKLATSCSTSREAALR